MDTSISSEQYWNNRYLHQETGWDMGQVSPPLKSYFEQLKDRSISILIPGCGNSYEAAWLLENGFTNITLIDISDLLVARLREKFIQYTTPPLRLIAGNFFDHSGNYDLIIEQTFFCALPPSMRPDYVRKMHELLNPGGRLVGLLFDRVFEGGPPFGGSREEYQPLLEPAFSIRTLEPCYNSITPREGTELFLIAQNK